MDDEEEEEEEGEDGCWPSGLLLGETWPIMCSSLQLLLEPRLSTSISVMLSSSPSLTEIFPVSIIDPGKKEDAVDPAMGEGTLPGSPDVVADAVVVDAEFGRLFDSAARAAKYHGAADAASKLYI